MGRGRRIQISLSNDEPWLRESKLIDVARLRAARIYNLQGEARIPAFVSSDGLIACRFLKAMQAIVEPAEPRRVCRRLICFSYAAMSDVSRAA
jgi:hypothetical protein